MRTLLTIICTLLTTFVMATGMPDSGSSYTKVCNSGELAGKGSCPTNPALGTETNEWACTRDNRTGLIWEVKLNDANHPRYKKWTYSWYDPYARGGTGTPSTGNCPNSNRCDTEKYAIDVNNSKLCDSNDWRIPSKQELLTITDPERKKPAIDTTYFPNTVSSSFWTATTDENNLSFAWDVYFANGKCYSDYKDGDNRVRVVHEGNR